jgi:dihydrofolate reductase
MLTREPERNLNDASRYLQNNGSTRTRSVMRKLIYSMTVSLDGYIAGPDGAIDWSVPDEELFRFHTQHVRETGVQLCGRRLYETMTKTFGSRVVYLRYRRVPDGP